MSQSLLRMCLILAVLLSLAACSKGGGDALTPATESLRGISEQLPIYFHPAPDGMIAGTAALGMYQVMIDTDGMSCEIVPLRVSSFVPKEYEVDLTNTLTTTFCKDCFKITSIGLAGNGNILLDVSVRHPFPKVTSIPPPPGQRPDLHVFDVQGIIVKDGSQSFTRSKIILNPTFVRNPDGFTTAFDKYIDYMSPVEPATTANAHPFKILSIGNYVIPGDDIGNYDIYSLNGYPNPQGLTNPRGLNVMKCGSPYMTTQYEIEPPSNAFRFFFVITCSFGESGKGSGTALQKRGNPIYLCPAFNKPEAWKVDVSVENNNLADNDNTSSAEVVIKACDWQQAYGRLPADPNFNPAVQTTTPKNTLIKESGIDMIEVDIPGLNDVIDKSSTATGGNGTYLNPRTFRITVNNDLFASEIPNPEIQPQFWGLAAVRDDLYGEANPIGGIDRDLKIPDSMFEISDYSTYQVFGISVMPPNDPPVPMIKCTAPVEGPPWPILIDSGTEVKFDALGSYDTDGSIMAYEWDFDYNPVTGIFDVDFTDPIVSVAADPPPWKMNNQLDELATKYVAVRVTDNNLPPCKSVDYASVDINANVAPTADLGVAFYTTLLSPPYLFYDGEKATLKPGPLTWDDGQIITYQYDFDYDPVTPFFTVDAANTNGAPVVSPILYQGSRHMATRVIDDGIPNKNNIEYSPITITGRAANLPIRLNAAGSTDVWLDNSGLHAISASDNYIVAAWRQTGNLADIFYAVSNDRGVTWTPQAVLNTTTSGTQKNVSLTCRQSTDVFYAVFESNASGAYAVNYAVSNIGASSWPLQGTVAPSSESPVDPSIAVNPIFNYTYVAYQAISGAQDIVYVRVSPDNGSSWSSPVTVSRSLVNDRTDPCIAYDTYMNRVGVAWDDQRYGSYYQIYFNWSDITGMSFQPTDVRVYSSTTGQTDPSLCVNASGMWILTFDNLSGTSDIYCTTSTNGTTWSAPVDCTDNSDSQHNDSSVCVDASGVIYMTTKDSRETGSSGDRDVYVFKSTDEGVTWVRGVRIDKGLVGEDASNPNICGLGATGETGFVAMFETPDNWVMAAKSNAY